MRSPEGPAVSLRTSIAELKNSAIEGVTFGPKPTVLCERSRKLPPLWTVPPGLPVLRADESWVEALANVLAERIAERLQPVDDGIVDAEGAALHLSTSRQRIHQLTSMGVLRPDGYDGRRPLYRRASLDRYVEGR